MKKNHQVQRPMAYSTHVRNISFVQSYPEAHGPLHSPEKFLICAKLLLYYNINKKKKKSLAFWESSPLHTSILCAKFDSFWPWEEILKFCQCSYYLPFEKGIGLEQTWIPFTQECFGPIWLKFALWWKMKMWKVNRQTVNNRQSEKLIWAVSLE